MGTGFTKQSCPGVSLRPWLLRSARAIFSQHLLCSVGSPLIGQMFPQTRSHPGFSACSREESAHPISQKSLGGREQAEATLGSQEPLKVTLVGIWTPSPPSLPEGTMFYFRR